MNLNSVMKIKEYEVWVSLGCSTEEQSYKQPVLFNIQFEFSSIQNCEKSDQLQDAVDYVTVTEILKKSAESKPYQLIEHMCFEATEKVFIFLKSKNLQGHLKVELLKLRPPVPNLNAGVSWLCQRQL